MQKEYQREGLKERGKEMKGRGKSRIEKRSIGESR